MKRILTLIVCAVLLLSTVGCSVRGLSEETKKVGGTETGEPAKETVKEDPVKAADPEIEEQLCFSYEGVRVTAKSVTKDSFWGSGVKLLIENDSSKDYSVGTRAVIVNDCMITSLFSAEVAAGKKSNETLYLSSSDLKTAGIETIGQIEICFYVYDSASDETVYEAECVTLRTSLYDPSLLKSDDSGHELYNRDGIRIIGKTIDEDSLLGANVLLMIENTTNRNITVSSDDLSVNGFMVSSLFADTVYAGKHAFGNITIFSSSLEENGITEIETVELKFRIYDSDTYQTIAQTDPIVFTAE